jgi:hypothetical protein
LSEKKTYIKNMEKNRNSKGDCVHERVDCQKKKKSAKREGSVGEEK